MASRSSNLGYRQLLEGEPWLEAGGIYPLPAYSEYMPAPLLGRRPYGSEDAVLFSPEDPWGWHVTEYEEELQLRPGIASLRRHLLRILRHLGRGEPAHGIARKKLVANPYWPEELLRHGAPGHESYVILLPVALSRTQDDKGRVRWTVFGGSEQGPARAFWRSFADPGGSSAQVAAAARPVEPAEAFSGFLSRLLAEAFGEIAAPATAGLRILSDQAPGAPPMQRMPAATSDPLPAWAAPYVLREDGPLAGVRYLLTFRPFGHLPPRVRSAYLAGDLHLLPFPGSLVFWGARDYRQLQSELPHASQIPLLHSLERSESPFGLRIPQSGWMHEPRPHAPHDPEAGEAGAEEHGPVRNSFRRTHRWAKVERHEDELAVGGHEDRTAHVLFSTAASDMGLYGKPMARNSQIWTRDFRLLLDGPRASREELAAAAARLAGGGLFGYRFHYPAMRVGRHEVYWHRPVAGCWPAGAEEPRAIPDAPLGYLTAYPPASDPSPPVELWPRLLARPAHLHALAQRLPAPAPPPDHQGTGQPLHPASPAVLARSTLNARRLLEAAELLAGGRLDPGLARALVRLGHGESLEGWLDRLPEESAGREAGDALAVELRALLAPDAGGGEDAGGAERSLTFRRTALRSFEEAYWRKIADLATGAFRNKDNADCVLDAATQARLAHSHRDLDALGEALLAYYRKEIASAGLEGSAVAGDLPFRWQTDFDFSWSGGWLGNHEGRLEERDLVVVIPGRDRGRAVIMADHYDTAYMEDIYGYQHGGAGPRLAAAGADDNHSATAALMLAAPIFLEMSRQGQLGCDVWLVHLTGEEFPSDCLGARHLVRCLVEGNLRLRLAGGRSLDLSATRVQGVYVLDMIAHNNDHARDIFQICPGTGRESLWLAWQANLANRLWNREAPHWNRRFRKGRRRGRRSADGKTMPATARHPELAGQVRPVVDPHSTLYNTDGQIFSDAGVPVVLFMEHYDINRHGYHDSHDTLENIDLDYGAAVAAIAIEAVARAATAPPPLPPSGAG